MGQVADLDATVGRSVAEVGVTHGDVLVAFAEAAVRGADDLDARRADLVAAVGPAGAGQACATVAAFSGLVRVADGTGIPIDDGLATASVEIREDLDLAAYAGAANSSVGPPTAAGFTTVDALWSA